MRLRLKLQYILSYSLIGAAAVLLIYVLGFMTDFFVLFMDGNSAMYDYFKDLQILNNTLFASALTALVMALFLPGFDITRKKPGLFGTLYVLAFTVVSILNGSRIVTYNTYFVNAYKQLDFTSLEGYRFSLMPFNLSLILFGLVVVLSLGLFMITSLNFLAGRTDGGKQNDT